MQRSWKKITQLSEYIFDNTSTIGLRYYPVKGRKLEREIKEFETPYGAVRVKIVETSTGMKKVKIEYDDLSKISKKTNKSIYYLQKQIINSIYTEI